MPCATISAALCHVSSSRPQASRNVVEELLSVGNDVMRTSMAEMSQKLADKASRVIDLFKKWDVGLPAPLLLIFTP